MEPNLRADGSSNDIANDRKRESRAVMFAQDVRVESPSSRAIVQFNRRINVDTIPKSVSVYYSRPNNCSKFPFAAKTYDICSNITSLALTSGVF